MTVKGLLAEAGLINNFRFRQVEKEGPTQTSGTDGAATVDNSEHIRQLESRISQLEKTVQNLSDLVKKLILAPSQDFKQVVKPPSPGQNTKPAQPAKTAGDDDDDVDLFGSDDDEAADELRKKRLEEYAQKKSKKPGPIAKSSVILDVKPWDDETDMEEMQRLVRTIEMDGLVWGAAKLAPLAYGIKKLQIVCVIEDEKVSIDELTEKIQEFEDHVQSVDIAAFNKV